MEPTVSCCNDIIGLVFPDERLEVGGVVFADEAVEGGLEIAEGMEDAILEPAPGQLGEAALYGSESGAGGPRAMEGPMRMAGEPLLDLVLLVGRIVVEDHVDPLVR
ncbi:hypothetical protein HHL26_20725 [Sphingobium sp. TB-6]|nr:hypothetical protein [Sphingobium sp. TB-6]